MTSRSLCLLQGVGVATHCAERQGEGETAICIVGDSLHGLSVLHKHEAELSGVHGSAGERRGS